MVGSAKSEQQKLSQQYLPYVLGTSETALSSSISNTHTHRSQSSSLQHSNDTQNKWYISSASEIPIISNSAYVNYSSFLVFNLAGQHKHHQ